VAEDAAALAWLETLSPPTVAAPPTCNGQRVRRFVPNNDLDAKGDPGLVEKVRAGKTWHPRLIEGIPRLLYVWKLSEDDIPSEYLARIIALSTNLYQLGRGIDMAWANASEVTEVELEHQLAAQPGRVFRPCSHATVSGLHLACPSPGSLESLRARHEAALGRLEPERVDGKDLLVFAQPPQPRFTTVSYDAPPARAVFELQSTERVGVFHAAPLVDAGALTERLRDTAALRLGEALPDLAEDIEQALVGRTPAGRVSLAPGRRVRLRPLPSIGHTHTHPGIRRLLVDVPGDCPLRPGDVFWAFSGLVAREGTVLTRHEDERMLHHYGIGNPGRRWRTITPVALPVAAARRRVAPEPESADTKGSRERIAEERRAVAAVRQALRHAGCRAPVQFIHVQREPFARRGARAEAFARRTRFEKERLWHVEVGFSEPISGPLTIGDGRFLGLGLMYPAPAPMGPVAFQVVAGWTGAGEPEQVARALRRAVMARVQSRVGEKRTLSYFFTGHDSSGKPAQGHKHVGFVYDPVDHRLLVLPPHVFERREPSGWERRQLRLLDEALAGFTQLRAGRAGLLRLVPVALGSFGQACTWVSRTPYVVERHVKRVGVEQAIERDVRGACVDAGLPEPSVTVKRTRGIPKLGLSGDLVLEFPRAVAGPLSLGRTRHLGGGWFVPQ